MGPLGVTEKPPEKSGGFVVSGVGEGESKEPKSPSKGQFSDVQTSRSVVQIECENEDDALLLAEYLRQLLLPEGQDHDSEE